MYGSPFYLILTERRVSNYIDKHYTTLAVSEVFFDGEYKASVVDRFGDIYTMTYDPKTDMIDDTYYSDTLIVMTSLYRNNIRQLLNIEGIDINCDQILLDLDIPMYLFEVGEIGSGEDCECNITINLEGEYGNSISFGKDAFLVFKALRYSLISIDHITVVGNAKAGTYQVVASKNIYPADENTTVLLTEFIKIPEDQG